MKNYKRALNALNKFYNNRAKEIKANKWRLNSCGLRVEMTPAGLRADLRNNEKKRAAALAWLERCNNAAPLDLVLIRVEWVKNRTWGNNPRAAVSVYNTDGNAEHLNGSASGCGYDKESAAIDHALTESIIFSRFLIENWRRVCGCYGVSMRRGLPELDINRKMIARECKTMAKNYYNFFQ